MNFISKLVRIKTKTGLKEVEPGIMESPKKSLLETAKSSFCRSPIKAHSVAPFCIDTDYWGWYNDLKLKVKYLPAGKRN